MWNHLATVGLSNFGRVLGPQQLPGEMQSMLVVIITNELRWRKREGESVLFAVRTSRGFPRTLSPQCPRPSQSQDGIVAQHA